MKSKPFFLLSFLPLFLLQACGGGSIVLKSSDGSKISFKKENVSCQYSDIWIECTANGVRTDLINKQYPFSEEEFCYNEFTGSNELILDSFACSAAQKFGLLKKSE